MNYEKRLSSNPAYMLHAKDAYKNGGAERTAATFVRKKLKE